MKKFLKYVVPSVLAFALSGIYAIVDGFFVGNSVGDVGLSAINVVYPVVTLMQSAGTGIGMGGAVMWTVRRAEGQKEDGDEYVRTALRLLLLAMYWFDPFVWLAARLSKIDCELACDDLALRRLDDGARIAYGRTLLDQISIKRAPMQAALCATTMVSGKKTLRARIQR